MADDRRTDPFGRDRLDEIEKGYKARAKENHEAIDRDHDLIEVLMSRTFWLLAAVVVILFITGAVTTINWIRISDNVKQIQSQRVEAISTNCKDTNARHDATIARVKVIVEKIKDPVEKAQAEQGLDNTKSIIDALAPKQNCKALVAQLVKPVN